MQWKRHVISVYFVLILLILVSWVLSIGVTPLSATPYSPENIPVSEATWIERFDGPNLVTNNSFESGSGEDADNWVESGAAQRQPWANRTGSWGMAMCWWVGGGTGEAYQSIGVEGGKEYIYKIWALRDPGDLIGSFYMSLKWYKDGGTTYIREDNQVITVSPDRWEEKVLTAVSPVDADTVRVVIGSTGVNRAGKFDDVEFKTGSANHNDDWRLGVGNIKYYERYSYLKFDLSHLPPYFRIRSATLYAYYTYGGSPGDNIALHKQENDDWTDETLTWCNAPRPRYGDYITENYVPSASGWVSWDVTSWIDNQYRGDKKASIVIKTSGKTEFWLVSDNGTERPYLRVALLEPILISEVYVNAFNEDDSEFVELYNSGDTAVDISGWTIYRPGSDILEVTIPPGTVIQPRHHYLIADAGWSANRDNLNWPLANLEDEMTIPNENSGLQLRRADGVVVDRVGWGAVPAGWYEGTPLPNTVADGQGFTRHADGVDWDNNAADWRRYEQGESTPIPITLRGMVLLATVLAVPIYLLLRKARSWCGSSSTSSGRSGLTRRSSR